MSIQVIYQSLPIAKEPRFRLQDGGLFIELDSPMPVATALQVAAGEHSLSGKVRRVREGAGAGMLVVPTDKGKLPRWLLGLGAEVGAGVEFEPEPAPPAPVVEVKPAEPVAEAKPAEPVVEAKPADGSAEAAPSKQTPAEAANGDEEDEDGKSTTKAGDKKPAASKAKKKPRRR